MRGRQSRAILVTGALVLLVACSQTPAPAPTSTALPTQTATVAPTATTAATEAPTVEVTAVPTAAPTQTPLPPTQTPLPAPTDVPTQTPVASVVPTPAPPAAGEPTYQDNRSDAIAVVQSLYNAINRREYARAYGYWEENSDVGSFEQFQQGYADTISVAVVTGPVTGDAGAGQRYYSVPVTLSAVQQGGATRRFVGCYTLHQSNPAFFGEPPFHPLAIRSASIQAVPDSADTTALMASACSANGSPASTPGEPGYLDDRSTPEQVVQSLYNAINRQEYVRAYSYWQAAAPPFEQFQSGYANTQSVMVTPGASSQGAAAGNLYYTLPVTLQATGNDGAVEIFTGCYRLHLAQPQIQGPPFQPMGIDAANIQPVGQGQPVPAPDPATCVFDM